MSGVLEGVLLDLAAQSERLDALVAPLSDAEWAIPTPAAGWDIRHQIAHLAWTDESAVAAASDKAAWDSLVLDAMSDPEGFVDAQAAHGAQASAAALLQRWRTSRAALQRVLRKVPDGVRLPWYGPPMSATSMATARFMETWAHGLDVADAVGASMIPDDSVRHVAHIGVRTRDFAFGAHGLVVPDEAFHVSLVAPSGATWTWGPEGASQRVTGSAYDFALLVTQRRNRADLDLVATGTDADRWLDVAQAFAGPPGRGRTANDGAGDDDG